MKSGSGVFMRIFTKICPLARKLWGRGEEAKDGDAMSPCLFTIHGKMVAINIFERFENIHSEGTCTSWWPGLHNAVTSHSVPIYINIGPFHIYGS